MRSAGGLSPALSRPQGFGATFFAKLVKIFLLSAYTIKICTDSFKNCIVASARFIRFPLAPS